MKLNHIIALIASAIVAFSVAFTLPESLSSLSIPSSDESPFSSLFSLEKRKGGGGRGGGFSSSGGSSSSSSSGGRSGSSSSGSGSTGSSGATSGGVRGGGAGGSPPAYRGSNGAPYYAGGAATPYRAGASRAGVAPFLLGGAALAVLPAAFLYGAYVYPYNHVYGYRNYTSNQNDTAMVDCVCGRYQQCGCDDKSNDPDYVQNLIGNGSYAAMADNGVYRAQNGTLFVDGSLPNDTTSASSALNNDDDDTSAGTGMRSLVEASGWWATIAVVGATIWLS